MFKWICIVLLLSGCLRTGDVVITKDANVMLSATTCECPKQGTTKKSCEPETISIYNISLELFGFNASYPQHIYPNTLSSLNLSGANKGIIIHSSTKLYECWIPFHSTECYAMDVDSCWGGDIDNCLSLFEIVK